MSKFRFWLWPDFWNENRCGRLMEVFKAISATEFEDGFVLLLSLSEIRGGAMEPFVSLSFGLRLVRISYVRFFLFHDFFVLAHLCPFFYLFRLLSVCCLFPLWNSTKESTLDSYIQTVCDLVAAKTVSCYDANLLCSIISSKAEKADGWMDAFGLSDLAEEALDGLSSENNIENTKKTMHDECGSNVKPNVEELVWVKTVILMPKDSGCLRVILTRKIGSQSWKTGLKVYGNAFSDLESVLCICFFWITDLWHFNVCVLRKRQMEKHNGTCVICVL